MKIYTIDDENRISKVLRAIQNSVPESLRKAAVSENKLTPTIEMVMNKALESDKISEEKKEAIRNLLESGDISKTVPTENKKITKQIDAFVNREINKAIKEGRLPPKSHLKYLPSVIKTNESKN